MNFWEIPGKRVYKLNARGHNLAGKKIASTPCAKNKCSTTLPGNV
jgi:hypothetical protein